MKIAITGHTSGIGKAVYEKLSPNCLGFSRTNGYDISKKEDRLRIINQSADCDVFINNAHSDDFSQTELLLDIWLKWNHLNKKIINVGSDISLYNVSVLQSRPHLLEYRMHKMSLKNLCEDLTILPSNLKIEYASFGYVGTDRIFKKYPNMPSNMYITVDEAVRIILEKM
jgi:hypothetical protein